jgi:WD40 repeat protein
MGSKLSTKEKENTFITGGGIEMKDEKEIQFKESDVKMLNQWSAHKDAINWVCWSPELKVASSCSFDCNVYMWFNDSQDKRAGSLILGNRAVPVG